MATYMKCARNYTLRSLTGHILTFKANTPRAVPDICVEEALAVNIIPCDGYGPEAPDDAPKVLHTPSMSIEMREALLLHAIDEIYRDADSKDFDGGGKPKAAAISDKAGVPIGANERNRLWDKYRDIRGSNSDLPRPRNFELIADAQRLVTKKDLMAFAQNADVDTKPLEGMTTKEIKAHVINTILTQKTPAKTPAPEEAE